MTDDRRRAPPAPSATYSRIGRLTPLSKFEPVPIVLEISSTVLRVGFAGEKSRPQHVILLEGAIFDRDDETETRGKDSKTNNSNSSNQTTKTKTESEWYLILSPLIEQVYDRLMCKPSTRRVVCVYANQRYSPAPFRRALRQHLWNRGVPAAVELDPLEVLPIVQGWTRGLAMNLTREEAYCFCLSDGYTLPYTYQMVPEGGYKHRLLVNGKTNKNERDVLPPLATTSEGNGNDDDNDDENKTREEESVRSMVGAILACLQNCPRDLRSDVVSNVVFCGDGVLLLPDLPRRVMKRVRDVLLSDKENDASSAANVNANANDAAAAAGSASGSPETLYGSVPLDLAGLRSLAPRVALTSCAPYRPDWICWVGASLWASVWNKYNDEETPIPWMFNNSNNNIEKSNTVPLR